MSTEAEAENDIREAIRRSVNQNEIVHLGHTLFREAALLAEAEDYTTARGRRGCVEAWGSKDGYEWRVHLTRDRDW